MSPTARTLQWLRKVGYRADVVERWNPHAKVRNDLFGFIDVVAMHVGHRGLLGVQATSGNNHSARVKKISALPTAFEWLDTGNRIWVMSWSKKGHGKTKWEPRIEHIHKEMLEYSA